MTRSQKQITLKTIQLNLFKHFKQHKNDHNYLSANSLQQEIITDILKTSAKQAGYEEFGIWITQKREHSIPKVLEHINAKKGNQGTSIPKTARKVIADALEEAHEQFQKDKTKSWIREKGYQMLETLGGSIEKAPNTKTQPEQIAGIDCIRVTPSTKDSKYLIFYVHGGSYCLGSAEIYTGMVSQFTHQLGIEAIIPNYRKAPQYPFPAGQNDLFDVYKTLIKDNANLNIILIGDSSGGGLGLSLLHRIRVESVKQPSLYIGLSPWLDLRPGTYEHGAREEEYYTSVREGFVNLYSEGVNDADSNPGLNPILMDTHSLPPVLIQIGEDDFVRKQCEAFVEGIQNTQNKPILSLYDGQDHDWILLEPKSDASKTALQEIEQVIKQVKSHEILAWNYA